MSKQIKQLKCMTQNHTQQTTKVAGRYFYHLATFSFCLLLIMLLFSTTPVCATTAPLGINDFSLSAEQGLGDRQNSVIWGMQWWDKTGKLYVGTNRAWLCWSYAGTVATYPVLDYLYPPADPDVECSEDYNDLPLQAEIWAWDPVSDTWERVYQSPQDVPIPGTDKFVSRDIAFRSIEIFTEPDGSEALYICGTSSKPIHKDVPPPRILRTTDGINFNAIPQDPGTFMGSLPKASFRSLTTYKDRMFVIHGSVQGNGKIYESSDPANGNDAWRQVSPDDPDLRVFELQTFNGYLYVGALDLEGGYSVLKTDAEGTPPYQFIPVVTNGAYLPNPSRAVVSMHEYNGYLYVGTDGPSELIRIRPDDSWELVVGTPRETPAGFKNPLSGLDEGLNFGLNEHLWRMQEHNGVLYVGTYDASTTQRTCPGKNEVLGDRKGFDLYCSTDGIHFSAITIDGFGDEFDFGVRTFQSTPFGLFMGTANYYYGGNVYRGMDEMDASLLDPPKQAQGLNFLDMGALITWKKPENATTFRVYRSDFALIKMNIPGGFLPDWIDPYDGCAGDVPMELLPQDITDLLLDEELMKLMESSTVFPGNRGQEVARAGGTELCTTGLHYYFDTSINLANKYSYYIIAEDEHGNQSGSSNLVTFPLVDIQMGDLDRDGDIDMSDYSLFRSTLGKCSGDDAFMPEADFDLDGCISYADYRLWYGYFRNQLR